MLQGLAGALPAVIVGIDRRLVRRLREAGAASAEAAIALSAPSPLVRARLRRLVGVGAVHTTGEERFFLDEAGWDRYQRARRRRVLIAITLALVGIAIVYLLA